MKLKIDKVSIVRQRLLESGFEETGPRTFEENWVYDFKGDPLRKSQSLLRVRHTAGRWVVTFKAPPEPHLRYKIREEFETEVADGEILRSILSHLKMNETFRYQKWRSEFHRRTETSGHVLWDETPIGDFLEIEGEPQWIDQVAAQLGFSAKDYILKSYAVLFLETCAEQRIQSNSMVFKETAPHG